MSYKIVNNKYSRVKFSELNIGDLFRYKKNIFHKTLLVDTRTYIYNAITEETYGQVLIVCLPDDEVVNKIIK